MVRNDLILHSDNFHIIYIRKLTFVKIPQVARALPSAKYHLTIYIIWSDDFHTIRNFMEILFLATSVDYNVTVYVRTVCGIAGSFIFEFYIN